MKEKTIGIEVISYNPERIMGRLVKAKVNVKIDEHGYIVVTQEITGPVFTLNPITGEFGVHSGTLESAQEVGRKLRDIGFEPTKLFFNDKEYEF